MFEAVIMTSRMDRVPLAQLSQLAEFEGQNPFVFKGGIEKVFTTERARERAGRAGWR